MRQLGVVDNDQMRSDDSRGLPTRMNTNNSRASTPTSEASADRRGLPDGASVSATFMSFMQPIFDGLGNNREAWSNLATVAWTVWNSAVLDAVQGGSHLAEVRKRLHGSASFPLAEILIQRKRDAFPRHLWLVGECKFYDDVNGSPRLRVEAALGLLRSSRRRDCNVTLHDATAMIQQVVAKLQQQGNVEGERAANHDPARHRDAADRTRHVSHARRSA